ncbi:MAG: hypothetical protein E6Q88_04195 [Lysobacteraceae bacterium]|nr:MAG: hypothetical protein E6Q88_04195 [Xanthomonadaceae bacterium]
MVRGLCGVGFGRDQALPRFHFHQPRVDAFLGRLGILFRAGARVPFFLKRKGRKKTLKSNSNLPSGAWSGFFDEASLSHRKTMHILCIALRVCGCGMGREVWKVVETERLRVLGADSCCRSGFSRDKAAAIVSLSSAAGAASFSSYRIAYLGRSGFSRDKAPAIVSLSSAAGAASFSSHRIACLGRSGFSRDQYHQA